MRSLNSLCVQCENVPAKFSRYETGGGGEKQEKIVCAEPVMDRDSKMRQ